MVVGAAGVVPSGVSAHHAGENIVIEVSCKDRTVTSTVPFIGFSDGHDLRITTDVEGTEFYKTAEDLNGSGTVEAGPYPIVYDTGNVTVTAQAQYPDGSKENEPVVKRVSYDCPKPPYECPEGTKWVDSNHDGIVQKDECKTPPPPKPHLRQPRVYVLPACGDPKKAYVIGNPNKVSVEVVVRYIGKRADGTKGLIRRIVRVPGHSQYRSRWFWVLGSSQMTFSWVKPGPNKLLLRSRVEAPGTYRDCPDNNPGIHHW